jgi:hypothetical protein
MAVLLYEKPNAEFQPSSDLANTQSRRRCLISFWSAPEFCNEILCSRIVSRFIVKTYMVSPSHVHASTSPNMQAYLPLTDAR